jgi:hypothetical protein
VDGASLGAATSHQFNNVIADHTLTAVFTQIEHALVVSVVGNGSVASNPSQTTYHYGDLVQLAATSEAGWSFSGWSGDFSNSANPISVIINGSTSVTATFAQSASYVLTVSTVGSGSVGKAPDKPSYLLGEAVTLTATTVAGWSFSGWSGDFSSTENPVSVTVNESISVLATFTQIECTFTINVMGAGSVVKSPDGETYYYSDVVQLTAVPSAGWSFSSWSGALSGSANPADLYITGDLSVAATFTQNTYSLTVSTIGNGSVVINPSQASYHYGDAVQLAAIPAINWRFGVWTGDLFGSWLASTRLPRLLAKEAQ